MKKRRIRKRIFCVLLCFVTLLSSVLYAYKNAEEVYAVAVVDDVALVILGLMAACGAGYVGYQWNQSGGMEEFASNLAELEDEFAEMYDESVKAEIINFPSQGDPDDSDPEQDDPEDKLFSWKKLKAWVELHPGEVISIAANTAIGNVISNLAVKLGNKTLENEMYSQDNLPRLDVLANGYPPELKSADYPYYFVDKLGVNYRLFSGSIYLYEGSQGRIHSHSPNSNVRFIWYQYGKKVSAGSWNSGSGILGSKDNFFTNMPIYADSSSAKIAFESSEAPGLRMPKITPSTLPLSEDLQSWINDHPNNGKLDQPFYPNFIFPNLEQLQQLAQQLQDLPDLGRLEDTRPVVNNFIDNITGLDPSIDPNPDPGTDPDPDPGTDPDPDPGTDPEPGTVPNPGGDGQIPDYTADLKEIFPFCIPFDLIRAFKVLSKPAEAPVFKIPFKVDYGAVHIDEKWEIDMADYEYVIQILRVFETLGFIVGLILITRNLIKG